VTKTVLIVSVFALASGAYPSTIYQQSGSASLICGWVGQSPPPNGQFSTHTSVTGTAIDLACPTNSGYAGPSFHGAADPLSVVGNASGNGPNFGGVGVQWDFQSSATDALVATGGTGSGIVTFTVNWAWNAGDDDCCGEQAIAEFDYNGVKVWSATDGPNNITPPFPHTWTVTLDEPFTYGVPFTWSAHVEVTGGGNGSIISSSALDIGASGPALVDALATTPELSTLQLFGEGLLVLCAALRIRAKIIKSAR
jgi:hypothetical protein